jgi:prophage maintenance system killer protein
MHTDATAVVKYIRSEHDRWLKELRVSEDDPYAGYTTVSLREVLNAHFLLAEFFARTGEGLGGLGPKEPNLLHSALSRQLTAFGNRPRWSSRIEVCATLMYGLIKNHPFHDANKRTAFLVSILHLQKIGRTPVADHRAYEDFTVDIADNKLEKYPAYARFIQMPRLDREIQTITHFIKRSSREIDLRVKTITYNQLNTILRASGLRLENPLKNRIDLVRFLDENDLSPLETPRRIAHIGFPGWTKQVSRKVVHVVRSAAELDVEHGYDSQAFFNGVDTPWTLIKKYEELLRRLAYR